MEIRKLLGTDFEFYANNCLFIRPRNGRVEPFVFNATQRHVNRKLTEQKTRTGMVRAIILKGRQMGISTLVAARYYWITTNNMGMKTFILTHEDKATMNLFQMVKRYHENCPFFVKAEASKDNANELSFAGLDSSYSLATAKTKGAGRSSTVQLLHGSEVAFWANAEDHIAGLFQAVPRVTGTEIILESTANGQDNFFFEKWQQAMSGNDEYQAIFVPWFWEPTYRALPQDRLILDDYEKILKDLYRIDDSQLYWRRLKIQEGGGAALGESLFKREYPCNPVEAFEESVENALFPSNLILAARRYTIENPVGPLIIGVDVGGMGKDKTTIIRRRGRKAYKLEVHSKIDEMEIVGLIVNAIREESPDKVFVDSIGIGSGVVSRCRELGYKNIVQGVMGSSSADCFNKDKYVNKRDEMHGELLAWIKDEPCDIPDDNMLAQDLSSVRFNFTSTGQLKLLPKKETAGKILNRSPDRGDALALTFAFPVVYREKNPVYEHYQKERQGGRRSWAV